MGVFKYNMGGGAQIPICSVRTIPWTLGEPTLIFFIAGGGCMGHADL